MRAKIAARANKVALGLSVGFCALVFASACGSSEGSAGAESTSYSESIGSASTLAPAASSATSAEQGSAGSSQSWVMPDQVGQDLQDSQNAIQKLTDYAIFNTDSEDASGDSRSQIIDHDWKVCSQNIAAGTRITKDSKIVFRVVKQDESCP